jgi:hypothetical protein
MRSSTLYSISSGSSVFRGLYGHDEHPNYVNYHTFVFQRLNDALAQVKPPIETDDTDKWECDMVTTDDFPSEGSEDYPTLGEENRWGNYTEKESHRTEI